MKRKESEKASEPKPSHAESDSHYQLRLFLFQFTASSYWQSQTEGETKGNFHQTELPIKTCEMNVPQSRSGPPGRSVER